MEIKDLIGTCFVHMSDPYLYYLITDIRGTNIVIEWVNLGGKKDDSADYEIETALKYFNANTWVVVKEPIKYYYYVCKLPNNQLNDYVENTIYKINSHGSITTAGDYIPYCAITSKICYKYYYMDKFLPISELFVNELRTNGIAYHH